MRKSLEQQFHQEYDQVEEERNQQYKLEDQKNQLGRQYEAMLQQICNDEDEKEKANDAKLAALEKLNKALANSKQLQQ